MQVMYPKMVHLTCLVHGLHRVAEEIRLNFPDLDRLVANIKKVFLKAPNRIEKFKEILPGVPLPPQPIITRWGTWIAAVKYLATYFESIVKILNEFDAEEATAIKICKNILQIVKTKRDLIFVSSNYGFLCDEITKLEKNQMALSDSFPIVLKAFDQIKQVKGSIASSISQKFCTVLQKNPGFEIMKSIFSALEGNLNDDPVDVISSMSSDDILSLKYSPITSCEVERSFSRYKHILNDDKRTNLSMDNIKYIFITSVNQF